MIAETLMKKKAITENQRQNLMKLESLVFVLILMNIPVFIGKMCGVEIKIYISFCAHRIGYERGLLLLYTHYIF